MTFSMTAFARGTESTTWGELTCELRSVNHRFLEIHPRLAEELRQIEPRLREQFGEVLKRGRVDCTLRFQWREQTTTDFEVDEAMVGRLVRLGREIRDRNEDIQPLRAVDVLRWPGVVQTAEVDFERLSEVALELVKRTLDQLLATREREGRKLAAIMQDRVAALVAIVGDLQRELPGFYESFRSRIEARLAELRNELEPARLEQEMVLLLQKADVSEEVDRLGVHLEEVTRVLAQPGPVGRRLDFLMQELNREANTLGSKAIDARLTKASVDLKVLIEQLREQVQNIE